MATDSAASPQSLSATGHQSLRRVLALLLLAVGVVAVGRQLMQLASGGELAAGVVVLGLTAIAGAEVLLTAEQFSIAWKHELARLAVFIPSTFIAVSALQGGTALLRGLFDDVVSVDWLVGTPFRDYAFPALVLVIVVGGSALLGAATVFIHRRWALLPSALVGLIMVSYLLVEAFTLDGKVGSVLPTVLVMQLAYFVPALAIVALAGWRWKAESTDSSL
jgi:hypothetical protein